MKKLTLLLGAVALLGLASCNEVEMPSNNGAKKGEVISALTINIATQANTKATATEVQADGSFRGMENMNLFVLTANPAGPNANFMAGYQYPLGSLTTADLATKSSKVYTLSFPTGVNNMVFYGIATKAGTSPAQYGKLAAFDIKPNKNDNKFAGFPIAADASDDQYANVYPLLSRILNDVISAQGWAALVDAETIDVSAIPLRDAYVQLTTIPTGEVRDGSAAGIKTVLKSLKAICDGILSSTSIATDATKAIATAIKNKIAAHYDVANDAFVNTNIPADFPRNVGMPSGVAQLTFNTETEKFDYKNTTPDVAGPGSAVDVRKIIYPAELTYWASSPIRVTDTEVVESDFPTTVANWDAAASWTEKNWQTPGTVASTTKGVALKNNINYGTALLETTVAIKGDLEDNREAVLKRINPSSTETDQTIEQSDCKFELLGVLVGGQPSQVGWDWTPVAAATFDNTVYDTYFGASAFNIPTTGKSASAYTMLFDNLKPGATTADQNTVKVALELRNNTGKDFYGNANLIPAGAIFYLVGELDPTSVDISDVQAAYPKNTDGNGYRFPPFTTTGANNTVIRVFMQDFVTTANFTIASLKKAYSTVPDLRSADIKFGLSVDLVWKAGMTFDVELQ